GLVDRAHHGVVPGWHAARLHELAAGDGAVRRAAHLDAGQRIAGDLVGEGDVGLHARLDATGITRARAGRLHRGAGAVLGAGRARLAHHARELVLARLGGDRLLLLALLVLLLALGVLALLVFALLLLGLLLRLELLLLLVGLALLALLLLAL